MSLRRTTLRSLALVMTGAVALFGAVALAGARGDLLSGLEGMGKANAAAGNIWVVTPKDVEVTDTFRAGGAAARLARVPGVTSVSVLQDAFIDLGDTRAVIFARPNNTGRQIVATQLVKGNASFADRRLGEGGWIALSRQLADQRHVTIGGQLSLPTPTGPARLRVAALTTDFGWPGGGIVMNARDFSRLWASAAPTALVVSLAPRSNFAQTRRVIAGALGESGGLEVMTATTGYDRFLDAANEGLSQLQWISLMLIAAAILAMAAALTADIWQQRPWLSDLRLASVPDHRLRLIMLMKSGLTLGAGCVAGAVAGIYGQVILNAYLKHVTGLPVETFASGLRALVTFAVVIAAALLIALLPIWLASRVPLAVALENE